MKKPRELALVLALLREGPPSLRIKILLLSGCGTGFSPLAPGSAGTLFAWGFIAALKAPPWIILASGISLFVLGFLILNTPALKEFATHDSPWIVLDEIAAYFILFGTLAPRTLGEEVVSFLLFRAIDALKPFPIRHWEQRFIGSLGVMGDDLFASLWVIAAVFGVRACVY